MGCVCIMNYKNESVTILIRKSFLQMLTRKLYVDITVTDIVKNANVSRASFYRNYTSIDNICLDIISEIYANIDNKTQSLIYSSTEQWYNKMVEIYNYIYKEKNTFYTIQVENIYYIYYRLMQKINKDIPQNKFLLRDKYIMCTLIDVIFSIAKGWKIFGYNESAEFLANLTVDILKKLLNV